MITSTTIYGVGMDRALLGAAAAVNTDLSIAVYRTGAMVRTRVRANASGRPGPRVITGDYRRSISQLNKKDAKGVAEAHVYTNAPQALRLEYGFHGVDALGRSINQDPLPHWRPAMEGMDEFLTNQAGNQIQKASLKFGMTPLRTRFFRGI